MSVHSLFSFVISENWVYWKFLLLSPGNSETVLEVKFCIN